MGDNGSNFRLIRYKYYFTNRLQHIVGVFTPISFANNIYVSLSLGKEIFVSFSCNREAHCVEMLWKTGRLLTPRLRLWIHANYQHREAYSELPWWVPPQWVHSHVWTCSSHEDRRPPSAGREVCQGMFHNYFTTLHSTNELVSINTVKLNSIRSFYWVL